jgi:hypothetical protein
MCGTSRNSRRQLRRHPLRAMREERMKMVAQIMAIVAIGVVLLMPSAGAAETKYSGFLGDYYKNLSPGPEGGAKLRWLKPGVDFGKYNKVMVDSIIFYYADDSPDKGIDGELIKELSDACNEELVKALNNKYPVVAEPGPDVMRVRIALTNVKKSNPVLSAVTTVIPAGLGISLLRKGVTGSWSGSGATSAEMMGLDSMTNDVIALAVDDQSAGFTDRFSSFGSAREAFKFWAGRVRLMLDRAHELKNQ